MSTRDKITHYAAVSCDDSEKWGYSEATTDRLVEIHSREGECWTTFHAVRGEIPTVEDLQKFKGVIISGSPNSANDDIDWILKLQEFIKSAAKVGQNADNRIKIIGVCFAHQLIAKSLGGKVGLNPDKDFVIQTEEIKPVNEEGKEGLFKDVFKDGPIRLVECHGECVTELPEGAVSLATSDSCKHEIVQFSKNILGIQSHPEMKPVEAEGLVLPSISKKYNWSTEKIQRAKETFAMDLDADRFNKVMKTFLNQ